MIQKDNRTNDLFYQMKIIIFNILKIFTWTKNETQSQPTNIYATNFPGINDRPSTNAILKIKKT